MTDNQQSRISPWRRQLHTVIFGTETPTGRTFDILLMIIGYCIIAAPTRIVSAEISQRANPKTCPRPCPGGGASAHAPAAEYCQSCGERL